MDLEALQAMQRLSLQQDVRDQAEVSPSHMNQEDRNSREQNKTKTAIRDDKRCSNSSSAAYSAYVAEVHRQTNAVHHDAQAILSESHVDAAQAEPIERWSNEAGPYPFYQLPEPITTGTGHQKSEWSMSEPTESWLVLDPLEHLTAGVGEGAAQAGERYAEDELRSGLGPIRTSRTMEPDNARVRRPARMRKQRQNDGQAQFG